MRPCDLLRDPIDQTFACIGGSGAAKAFVLSRTENLADPVQREIQKAEHIANILKRKGVVKNALNLYCGEFRLKT